MFYPKKKIKYDTLDLSYKDQKLFSQLAYNSKKADKKNRLKTNNKKNTLGEVDGNCRKHKD